MFPINRVVALATPLFSAAGAVGSAWLLKHFPGAPVPSPTELLGVEITVATSATAAAVKWLHGHQRYEADLHKTLLAGVSLEAVAEKVDPGVRAYVEALVKAELAKVVREVAPAAPAPPAAPAVADAVELASPPAPVAVAVAASPAAPAASA